MGGIFGILGIDPTNVIGAGLTTFATVSNNNAQIAIAQQNLQAERLRAEAARTQTDSTNQLSRQREDQNRMIAVGLLVVVAGVISVRVLRSN